MGSRVSIQFKKDNKKSVVLFSHWGGEGFVENAQEYAEELKQTAIETGGMYPLHRLEPETVIVDFIRSLTSDMSEVASDLYLGKDKNDGDNRDFGHHIIEL